MAARQTNSKLQTSNPKLQSPNFLSYFHPLIFFLKEITIYTDGASRGNPGPGGYGAILMYGDRRKELSQGYRRTTNNRMELMGVIAALEALKKTKAEYYRLYRQPVHCESRERGLAE